eukprot:gene4969-5331_t
MPLLWVIYLLVFAKAGNGEGTLLYSSDHRAGISDRLFILRSILQLGIILNANVSFPRPCDLLTKTHTHELINCSIGWDHYISVTPSFHGYHSVTDNRNIRPICRDSFELTPSLMNSLNEVPSSSFCFNLSSHYFYVRESFGAMMMRLAPAGMSFPIVSIRHSNTVKIAAKDLLDHLGIMKSFGVIKLRRADIHRFQNCTSPSIVIKKWYEVLTQNMTSSISGSVEDSVTHMPWLIFGYVESNYWTRLRGEYEKSRLHKQGLVTRLFLESEITLRNGQLLHQGFRDNYFLVQVIMRLVELATISIGTHFNEGQHDYFCKNQQLRRVHAVY